MWMNPLLKSEKQLFKEAKKQKREDATYYSDLITKTNDADELESILEDIKIDKPALSYRAYLTLTFRAKRKIKALQSTRWVSVDEYKSLKRLKGEIGSVTK